METAEAHNRAVDDRPVLIKDLLSHGDKITALAARSAEIACDLDEPQLPKEALNVCV